MTHKEINLRGMTWSDPRGYDPVVTAAAQFSNNHPEVSISWDKRSLQGFESTAVTALAKQYDLMIIDHPHVGAAVRDGCLLPLDEFSDASDLLTLANETVGKSFYSYFLQTHQWALPVDAATQVQAHRPDLSGRATNWADVVTRARDGVVVWPLRPPHSLMSFFTLVANSGTPCSVGNGALISDRQGQKAFELMLAVARYVDPVCFEMDPIAALDALATGERYHLAPLVYLYAGYSRSGYRPQQIAFSNFPPAGKSGPLGSALGGTGIAVSANTKHPQMCAKFARWLASSECQCKTYVNANGQPANALAWSNEAANDQVLDAYYNTRSSHEAAWLRPRHAGYLNFQNVAACIINEVLQNKIDVNLGIKQLNERFIASFAVLE